MAKYAIFIIFAICSAERSKRFFPNLQTYFTRNASVSCVNCSQNYDVSSTPVTYLTPPTVVANYADYGYANFDPKKTKDHFRVIVDGDEGHLYEANRGADELKVSVKSMQCVKSPKYGKIAVDMCTSKNAVAPVLEMADGTSTRCSVTSLDSNSYRITIEEADFTSCGVHWCDSDADVNLMCLVVRFPTITGIKTADDTIMKFQCRPQPNSISHTKNLKLKPPSSSRSNKGRSLPVYTAISGGSSGSEFHSQIGLYGMTKNGFTRQIGINDPVFLGEDLQLRCIVRQGDGWRYSRFGTVLVQKERNQPTYGYVYEENDAVVIIADDGCANPLMKTICPLGQSNDPSDPLITLMNLRAFRIDQMKDDDELTMAVTVYGCINYEDCFPGNRVCGEWISSNRIKRTVVASNSTMDATAEIKFKIALNRSVSNTFPLRNNLNYILVTIALFLTVVSLITIVNLKSRYLKSNNIFYEF